MWGILQTYANESRAIRSTVKQKKLRALNQITAAGFVGAEFLFSSKRESRVFIDTLTTQVLGVQEASLCVDFVLPGTNTLFSDEAFVDSSRDFLARLSAAPAFLYGYTGSLYYWYGSPAVLEVFLVNSCLVDRMRLTRILVLNRLRRRVYTFRQFPCFRSHNVALWWTRACSEFVSVRLVVTLVFSSRCFLAALFYHLSFSSISG